MMMTRRLILSLAFAAAAALAPGHPAQAKIADTEEAMTELVIGEVDAPVEIIEYASLSCPACRHFHEEIYPKLKSEYIDTGKVRFIFRDFPTNSPGLAAAMIARCAGPERHAGMIDVFFDTQPQWGHSDNPLQALTMVSRMAGVGSTEVDQCVRNSELMNAIQKGAQRAHEELGVNATPTVFVAGEKAEHAMEWEKLKAEIDQALKTAE